MVAPGLGYAGHLLVRLALALRARPGASSLHGVRPDAAFGACTVSAQHTPRRMRKPGKREARGLSAILSEMDTAAHDMRGYPGRAEKKRADDIFAGLRWIDAAIDKATGSAA